MYTTNQINKITDKAKETVELFANSGKDKFSKYVDVGNTTLKLTVELVEKRPDTPRL